jgi:hypothetical protein
VIFSPIETKSRLADARGWEGGGARVIAMEVEFPFRVIKCSGTRQ